MSIPGDGIITKVDAIGSLYKGLYNTASDVRGIVWKDGHTTTDAENSAIDAEVIRLQAEYDAQDYARSRKAEYPSIGDQLDMIYHNGDGGVTFQAAIKAVKDKYPKE
jgi:L-ascorbate metabolism protein UlaG (beta-lactamase superfamily)